MNGPGKVMEEGIQTEGGRYLRKKGEGEREMEKNQGKRCGGMDTNWRRRECDGEGELESKIHLRKKWRDERSGRKKR